MIEFFLHIGEDGQILNEKVARNAYGQLTPGRWHVKMEIANKRSLSQNAYLHGVLIPEFKTALYNHGYRAVKLDSQAKLIMKNMFLQAEITNEETGEMLPYVKDTSELTTTEMNLLFEEVIQFSAEHLKYQIPYPNEQLRIA